MSSDYSRFIDDAPADKDISTLAALVGELYECELEVQSRERALKSAKKALQEIAERRIPDHMTACGLQEFTTTSGVKIHLKDKLFVTPKVADRQRVLNWLEDQGHGALIKRTVSINLGNESDHEAANLVDDLEKAGYTAREDRKVEPSTLKKFVADRLAAGEETPMDMLGARQLSVAEITDGKPKSAFEGE